MGIPKEVTLSISNMVKERIKVLRASQQLAFDANSLPRFIGCDERIEELELFMKRILLEEERNETRP